VADEMELLWDREVWVITAPVTAWAAGFGSCEKWQCWTMSSKYIQGCSSS